ncbi:19490_t:CDS:2 [Cetraspora pellucida]|uniref:19490_t:CDS:1 n=1 Tax=Cetraspora pellucida TaxID=1433469 RepID=A0A9N9CE30_9GLOM|nr:19490_t:CDS:2 [Cetraspora pellucida]
MDDKINIEGFFENDELSDKLNNESNKENTPAFKLRNLLKVATRGRPEAFTHYNNNQSQKPKDTKTLSNKQNQQKSKDTKGLSNK